MTTAIGASGPDAAQTGIDAVLQHVSILVVDDDPGIRSLLARTLAPHCKRVEKAANAAEASRMLDATSFDLVLLDNVMPGQSGLDWLAEQRRVGLFAEVILMTAYADLDTAIHAMRLGAADFVLKPFRSSQMLNAISRCIDQRYLRRENFLLKYELRAESQAARDRLIGSSPAIAAVRDALERVAPTAAPVLITGESGTGKEVAARNLHARSGRAERPFVPVNCASVLPDRLAADLFGDPGLGGDGLLVRASGGTLFLDEIGELPLAAQATLLQVIEDSHIRPPGAERELPMKLRFVLATNTDIEAAVAEGRFRRDLYHRINVVHVHMPPLRECIPDIPEFINMFMAEFALQLGVPPLPISEGVLVNLASHDWPGNVRELRNMIERSLILGGFPPEFATDCREGEGEGEVESADALHVIERRHILSVLEACGGNRAEAARRLGVSRKTIDRKCAQWNV